MTNSSNVSKALVICMHCVSVYEVCGQNTEGDKVAGWEAVEVDLHLADSGRLYEQVDEVTLVVRLENKGTGVLSGWQPDLVQRTLSFDVKHNGEVIQPQRRWSGPISRSAFVMQSGEVREWRFELSWLFPVILEAGEYQITATINLADQTKIYAGSVAFTVTPLTEEGQAEFRKFLEAMQGGEHVKVVELGTQFLRDYPTSKFAARMRLELGFALVKTGAHDRAIETYRAVVDSKLASLWQKQEANWRIAWEHHEKGDLESAIQVMQELRTNESERYVALWRTALGDRDGAENPK